MLFVYLTHPGLRKITLYSSVDPRRREAWIEKHFEADVLITNPRLVQTGLDLVSFQTVVFFEPEYSLYTLWQALRRVWRLGQTQPVKAVFAVYKDAMEARALALMGCKMRAAQTLYGDEVGGAIVPVEEGDFITELAREVLQGAELDDLQSLFADSHGSTGFADSCPTYPGGSLAALSGRLAACAVDRRFNLDLRPAPGEVAHSGWMCCRGPWVIADQFPQLGLWHVGDLRRLGDVGDRREPEDADAKIIIALVLLFADGLLFIPIVLVGGIRGVAALIRQA